MSKIIITTTHHIVPKSRDGSNIRANKVELDERVHNALHMIFSNMTPVEQMERLLRINATALTNEFKDDVSKILNLSNKDSEYVYKQGILVPKK